MFLIGVQEVMAVSGAVDFDKDGLSDVEEITVYFTDPHNHDTDGDGYADGLEITAHYSPHAGPGVTLSQYDYDNDGLSDWLELQFKSNISQRDSDQDGVGDYEEILASTDPANASPQAQLQQQIIVDLSTQRMEVRAEGIPIASFVVSTGKAGWETPQGSFVIQSKHPRAWSTSARLWMPYWQAFIGTTYGIHALPEWPNGYREGVGHLGIPVSHGCIRLGPTDASWLYDWTKVGAEVVVQ